MLFSPKEKGQGVIEYALIIVLIAIVVLAFIEFIWPIIDGWINEAENALS